MAAKVQSPHSELILEALRQVPVGQPVESGGVTDQQVRSGSAHQSQV